MFWTLSGLYYLSQTLNYGLPHIIVGITGLDGRAEESYLQILQFCKISS